MSIAGFTRPDEGAILLDGVDITAVEPEDRNFGLVFQGYALFPHLTVADNIAFPLKVRKWSREKISGKVEEMLRLVGLEAFATRKQKEASIQRQLKQLMQHKTVLAIAHRLSTIAELDRLIVLDEGRIVEESRHEELIAKGGLYARLWSRQSGGFLAADYRPLAH